jgi:hypothetical protein
MPCKMGKNRPAHGFRGEVPGTAIVRQLLPLSRRDRASPPFLNLLECRMSLRTQPVPLSGDEWREDGINVISMERNAAFLAVAQWDRTMWHSIRR